MSEDLRRHIMMQQRQSAPDYIQDGLIFWLDCLDFEQGQVWTDRVAGINFPMPATGITKNSDGSAAFDGNTAVYVNGDIQQTMGNCCAEIVINNKRTNPNYGIFGANNCLRYWFYNERILPHVLNSMNGTMHDQDEIYNSVVSEFLCDAGIAYLRSRDNTFYSSRVGYNDAYGNYGVISFGDVGTRRYFWTGDFYCIRYYNRPLNWEERLHNLEIDRRRFGAL